ncbi:Serpin [Dirofilaria immitis]|nr:Serpin [Dirofilaria immitis]
MVYLAADGGTKQELLKFLGETASETEVRMHFDKLIAEIYRRKNENYVLHLANRCYVREGFSTKQGFSNMLQFYYGDTLHYFHYNQRYQLAQDVNNWVSDNTNHKITQLLTPGSINENTQMLLLNAIYFSGTWETQFNDEKTRNATFYVSENETKNVSMMILKEEFSYYEDDSVQVLKLPYIGNEVEMVFILPKIRFGLSNVLENLGVEQLLTYISVTEPDDVLINLPKFQVQGDLDLKETLQKIGLMNAFSEGANFKELTDLAISVSKIMHKGFIKVNEKGTESAAAIAVNFDFRSLAPSKNSLLISRFSSQLSSLPDYIQFNFPVRLIQEIGRNGRSAVSSPASISTALFMIYLAADGETKQQLRKILGEHAMEIEIQRHFGKFLASVIGGKNNAYTLNIANRFYVQQRFSIKPSFPYILKLYYGETLHKFNYERKNQFIQEINNWISDKTNNKITESMMTMNFNSETEILIPMMQLRAKLPYYDDNFVKVVKMPYVDKVAKIQIDGRIEFGRNSEKFGNTDIFSKSANFKKLSDDPISVSNIIHNALFEIDEKGTAAEIGFDSAYASSEHFLMFDADQPFLYFVVKNLQTVLFVGQCSRFCSF